LHIPLSFYLLRCKFGLCSAFSHALLEVTRQAIIGADRITFRNYARPVKPVAFFAVID
jgi:hypothetical protein